MAQQRTDRKFLFNINTIISNQAGKVYGLHS